MKAVDSLMATFLVACWLTLSAVLMLNLLIALLSNTFQRCDPIASRVVSCCVAVVLQACVCCRVYDNAKANAVMQKAITIIGIEEGLSHEKREQFRAFIHSKKMAPLVTPYDDDDAVPGDDLQKVTIQVKEQLDEIEEKLNNGSYFDVAPKDRRLRKRGSVHKPPPSDVTEPRECFDFQSLDFIMVWKVAVVCRGRRLGEGGVVVAQGDE